MAGKKKRRTRKRKGRRSKRRSGMSKRRIILYGLLGLFVIFGFYVLYLDYTIQKRFEGHRWELPARVYAQPLEIYPGANISLSDTTSELRRLRYRKAAYAKKPGSYHFSGKQLVLYTRAFRFWDSSESARRVRLAFDDGVVQSVTDASSGTELALLRLDPVHIASIYPRHNEDRLLAKLDDVPSFLVKSLIQVEDRKFYQHSGIDYAAILRALYSNIKAGRTVQGGSTLTQQLVKNYFLTNKRSILRKINEALMAKLLEWRYEKRDILESYINEVYLGQDGKRSINGFALASQFYFSRSLKNLEPQQIALLVGLVKGPSFYDPRKHPKRALKRRNLVLSVLKEHGVLAANDYQRLLKSPLGVVKHRNSSLTSYPAFIDLIKRQLRRDYDESDLSSAGLRIFSTFNYRVQKQAERSLKQKLKSLDSSEATRNLQGAVIVTDVNSAEVLALVGDRKPRYAGFNRALDAIRPIGSLVKPAVYLAALQDPEFSLATLIDDDPLQVEQHDGIWAPENYDKEFHGQVPMFVALANSYNVATVRLGLEIGLDKVIDVINALGVNRPFRAYPSTLLGTLSMSPLEVAQMYQTLAGSGYFSPLRSIRAVLDAEGEPLNRYPLSVTQVVKPADSVLINYALHLVTRIGTAKQLNHMLPSGVHVAGKTGTTDDLRDSWFAGFSGNLLSVVWLGHDDDQSTNLTGSSGAMQVWAGMMRELDLQGLNMSIAEGIEMAWVDMQSGYRTDRDCQSALELPFKPGTMPEEYQACKRGLFDWLD